MSKTDLKFPHLMILFFHGSWNSIQTFTIGLLEIKLLVLRTESMKKITTSLLLFLFTISSFSQSNSEHLTFKGVPIDGTLSEYVMEMKKAGFTLVETKDGIAILEGDFAAYKDCAIGIVTLKQKDLVSKITVVFPDHDTWSSLSTNYYNLKELLTEKYGEPVENKEKFDTSSQPDDDYSKMFQVQFNNCIYYTTYETENGSIQLSIDHEGVSNCFVRLTYFDKTNSEIIRAKALDDL